MKFSGEIKFPDIDHPGVPVKMVIEGSQAELLVDGESLGRWSLYDVHARRLVASAFEIDLDGTEVTFVADDPVDFAYRGVEYMAEAWAGMKSKRFATRSLAVRKSRSNTIPSRIEEMKAAMFANLEGRTEPRQLAGEVAMPDAPVVGEEVFEPAPVEDVVAEEIGTEDVRWIEEERQRLAAERAQLEEERRLAEEREANRIEAYRLEMERLKADREQLARQAEELAEGEVPAIEEIADPIELFDETELVSQPAPVTDPEPVAEPEPEPEAVEAEPEPVAEAAPEREPVAEAASEPEAVEAEPEPVAEEELVAEAEPEPEAVEAESEPVAEAEPEPVSVGRATPVVDLNDLESEPLPVPDLDSAPAPRQPAMAGSRQKGGLMGAVRAAFRSSAREHDHQFVEAPGGIGITRYVCEECGYVSISA